MSETVQKGLVTENNTELMMRIAQHVLALILVLIAVLRSFSTGDSSLWVISIGIVLLAWDATWFLADRGMRKWFTPTTWIVGFTILWLFSVVISAEFIWIAFLLWLLAGHQFSLKVGIAYSGLIFAVVVLAPLLHFDALNFASVIGPAIGGLFAFGISRGYLQLLHSAREREELLASLQSAQLEFLLLQDELAVTQRESGAIEERTRIARDLHDTIAQSLTSIRLLAHASTSQVDAAQAIMTLQHIETIAKESLVDVRKILDELVPAELENTQIAIAIQNMLERLRQEFGVQFELHIDSELPKIRADVEVALLRTTQSALANIRLHSRANRIVVELFNRSNQLRLTISDNGVGFDTADWETSPTKESQKFGLRLMRDRLRELGGSLSINSSPETGTSVSVSLPSALSHSNSK